jgi:pilus assembly protein CpaC
MNFKTIMKSGAAALALAAIAATPLAAQKKPATAVSAKTPQRVITLEVGSGEQINLPVGISDVVTSNPGIADVDVRSPRQIYIFGKKAGQSTIYATDAAGRTVYSAQVQVAQNVNSVDQMLKLAMPDADIQTSFMNGLVLLTGTVAQPEDVAEAQALVSAFMGETEGSESPVRVISRLKTAVPQQVNLQVRIAEVSRSLAKDINSNFTARDNDGASGNGFLFVPARGRRVANFTDITDPVTGAVTGTAVNFDIPAGSNTLNMAKRLFGVDFALGLDFAERNGLAATLAQPNLTTVSGETAEFLAGGQFPIPIADNFGSVSVEFRDYGVSLKYTPTVLTDGRIQLRVRPEVSDISSQGAVRFGGTEIPAITTRMAETTVELGSGESFMIAGLMSNTSTASIDKYPGLGDVPILGALFKSNGWKRNETELVIVVTPYLVKPVSDSQIKLPTDGFNTPHDLERVLLNKVSKNSADGTRPMPKVAPDTISGPEFGTVSQTPPAVGAKPSKQAKSDSAASGPGFSFN